jgi:3-oxoacyl-[acyl-carrier protein] reductase
VTDETRTLSAFELTGRVAVVTGAASGLGRAGAVELARAGAAVVVVDRDPVGAAETVRAIDASGGSASAEVVDVTQRDAVLDLADRVLDRAGRLDVWVNAAAVRRRASVLDTSEAELDAHVAVNLKGVWWGCAAAGRAMVDAGRGSIVNITSAGAEVASPASGAYGATKAAVAQLTRTLAAELGPHGVRANCVAPGFVETPMTRADWTRPDGTVDEDARRAALDQLAGMLPLRRVGTPQDIAHCLLFLAADASSFVTGQVLRPNGGLPML